MTANRLEGLCALLGTDLAHATSVDVATCSDQDSAGARLVLTVEIALTADNFASVTQAAREMVLALRTTGQTKTTQ